MSDTESRKGWLVGIVPWTDGRREGDDLAAKHEAAMKPRVTREFLLKYSGSKWPRPDIGRNVLEFLGVPVEQAERALELIRTDALELGFITTINGTEFVEVSTDPRPPSNGAVIPPEVTRPPAPDDSQLSSSVTPVYQSPANAVQATVAPEDRRVFITHGKNQGIVEQIKKLLVFGDFLPVVSVENQTTAKPVPDKVMDDMRSCAAGIVHVGAEMKVLDSDGSEHQMLNPNVLIEIGAAMALYGRKFILLVDRGVKLPSNLQGLYGRCRTRS